jgi:putative ABC transport system ATP-binding protein
MLSRLNASGKTIVMVTHENDIASWSRRIVRMRDGEVESDLPNTPEPIDFSGPPLPMHLLEEAA